MESTLRPRYSSPPVALAREPSTPSRLSMGSVSVLTERSEEHTSELQSRRDIVCRLLLEKKKKELHLGSSTHAHHCFASFGASEATIFSKRGSPRRGSQ